MYFVSYMYLVFFINDIIVKSFSFVSNDVCLHMHMVGLLRGIVLLELHS